MTHRHGHRARAFTLLELIVVMGIIAFAAAILAPNLSTFSVGRDTQQTAGRIVALARYAHTQAITEARVYRLYLDAVHGTFWLAADDGTGNTQPAGNGMGAKFQAAAGMRMEVQVTPGAEVEFNTPATQPQQTTPQPPPISGQQIGPPGQLVYNVRWDAATYIEFQPDGRTDTAHIRLTDRLGDTVEIACPSPSESLAIVGGAEEAR